MTALRILHLEDDPNDTEIIHGVLESEGVACEVTRVESRDDFVAALEANGFDLILADFSLPAFDGLSALKIALEKRPDVPFIFVSGTLGEEVAIDALKIGATDYVLKQRLSRMASSVRRALREARDRAERKQAQQQLQRSEALLAEGQRISRTGCWEWVLSSGKVTWSDEQYRMLGFEPGKDEPSVALFLSVLHPEDRSRVRHDLEGATSAKGAYATSYRVVMRDGSIRHLRSVGRPVATGTGDVDEFIGITADITERVQTEAALLARQEELRRLESRVRQADKMEALGRLAGGIAHDFNNVLHGIVGYGEMLLQDTPEGSPLRRYAQNVLNAATRGRGLVDQILAYSRSQRGKREPVGISQVVAETLELVRGSLPANIGLEASAPASPLVVIGDETRLHQVVMNLCSNSIQAMGAGGTLRVALEAEDVRAERALSHGALGPGRYVRLTVADSGSGMDEATLSRLFEPFFTTKEIGRGTGLGLSLVYAIVTDSEGAIDVKSAPGGGSTFTIHLPRADVTLAAADEGAAPLPPDKAERMQNPTHLS